MSSRATKWRGDPNKHCAVATFASSPKVASRNNGMELPYIQNE
ncbi:hypothetical protein [Candidatus Tisiphia endosymbiont of Oplodontha viridula]